MDGAAAPLPHLAAIQRAFGDAHDMGSVRAHVGGPAAQASAAIDARAFTVDGAVAFAEPPDVRLAAHEATHVVQQRSGVRLARGIDQPGDPYERHADSVAERVAQGRSVAELLVSGANKGGAADHIQRDGPADAGAPPAGGQTTATGTAPAGQGSYTEQVRAAMDEPDPVAGVGNFPKAFSILNGLAMFDILKTLTDLESTAELDLLTAHLSEAAGVDRNRLVAAIHVVRIKHPGANRPSLPEIGQYAQEGAGLPPEQQADIVRYLMVGLSQADIAKLSSEGAAVAARGGAAPAGEPQAEQVDTTPQGENSLMAAAGTLIGPGMFSPGQQPVGFYFGILAHLGIAAFYVAEHAGDVVYTNFTKISTIVAAIARAAAGTPAPAPANGPAGPVSTEQLDSKPDIANMTRRHLYEIKPQTALAQAESEAAWYQETFLMLGVPMALGPMGEPGTVGFFYDGGWFINFESVAPGAIVYWRSKAPSERVRVKAPEGQPSPSYSFRLEPLTREQQQALAGTVTVAAAGGIMLYILYALAAAAA